MSRSLPLLFAGLLATAGALASAQSLDPNSVVNAGVQVTKMIDESRYAEVWDGASAVMKKTVAKETFVGSIGKTRQALGAAATRRVWTEVSRRESTGTPELPAGAYMNVAYRTTLANNKVVRELVSFRLDDDKTWRVVGYVAN